MKKNDVMMEIVEAVDITSIKSRAKEKLRRDMGPLLLTALNDPGTIEVMLNSDGKLWQERLREKMRCIGEIAPARAEAIIKTIAGYHGKEITRFTPTLEGTVPLDGSRFAAQLPPVVLNPTFAIRKKAVAIFTLDDYVKNKNMNADQGAIIKEAIKKRRNILVSGGTGSGKTTLINAIIHYKTISNPDERIFIIEDTGEIQCAAKNCVQYYTALGVTMTTLLKTSLRMRPDSLVIGEVRDEAALDLVDAWNTGHEGGAATLHANNSDAALMRLRSLITRNKYAPAEIEPLIAEAVHLIVQVARTSNGPRIQELLEIKGYENGHYLTFNPLKQETRHCASL